ncbi:MAG: 3'(2'),5'-bisphosphate nucleotidase CysQ [Polyangiaceae bacterium]
MTEASMFEPELAVMRRLAREASTLVMRIYHEGFEVEMKGKNDPVTRADREANDLITAGLAAAFPDAGVMAEESAPSDEERVKISARPRIFFVDPVDGTREFADKNGEFCVMIGFAVDGRAVAGVVAVPAEGRLYWGSRPSGTFVEPLEGGAATPLAATPVSDRLRAVVSRSHPSSRTRAILDRIGVAETVPCGSVGLKVVRVLEGRADLYVHPSRGAKLWDSCAPEALLAGVGSVLTDSAGKPIDYSGPLGLEDGLIAASPALLTRVVDAVAAG